MKQTLVIYFKHSRKFIAAFNLGIITQADVIKSTDVEYAITFEEDIFFSDESGNVFVRDNIKTVAGG